MDFARCSRSAGRTSPTTSTRSSSSTSSSSSSGCCSPGSRGCPTTPTLRAVVDFIHQVTDPYLNLFRRFLPPLGGGADGDRHQPDHRDLRAADPAGGRRRPDRPRLSRASGWRVLLKALLVCGAVVALDQLSKGVVREQIARGEQRRGAAVPGPDQHPQPRRRLRPRGGRLAAADRGRAGAAGRPAGLPRRLRRGADRRCLAAGRRCWSAARWATSPTACATDAVTDFIDFPPGRPSTSPTSRSWSGWCCWCCCPRPGATNRDMSREP